MSRASGCLFLSGRACHGIFSGVVSGRAIWLLTDKTESISKTAASFNGGKIQGINIHGIWVSSQVRRLWMGDVFWSQSLWSGPLMHEGHLSSNFLLKVEVGSFVVPSSNGGRDGVHGLDAMHNPGQDSS